MPSVSRGRILKSGNHSGKSVLYWMSRDKRVADNWALIAAQKVAIDNRVPLIVCFQYLGEFPLSNIRQYGFLIRGLQETSRKLYDLNIHFYLLKGRAEQKITELIQKRSVGTMIVDYSPLKIYRSRLKKVLQKVNIPTYQVDTHNIIPVWTASDKKEYAAYTIRKKITDQLNNYLTDIPQIVQHPFDGDSLKNESFEESILSLNIDRSVKEIDWLIPGEKAALEKLDYLKKGLKQYSIDRNNPNLKALSDLSPYFHYGHISPQRVAFEINKTDLPSEDKQAFLEEMIVRRELSDNFCEYEPSYDFFEGFHPWAQKTLNEHRNDEREYLYSPEQFEAAQTHDPLWNAAQNQMMKTAKMHGYMRMYWAKKILEWSPSPELALQTAIELNDKYELDGRDPNGYTGIAWSIGGIHDRAWFERPVYGKIRYMNYNGCKSKFDVKTYIEMNLS